VLFSALLLRSLAYVLAFCRSTHCTLYNIRIYFLQKDIAMSECEQADTPTRPEDFVLVDHLRLVSLGCLFSCAWNNNVGSLLQDT